MKQIHKRIISAVLAIVLFAGNFPVLTSASSNFAISCEGEIVTQVQFFEHEKLPVNAEHFPGGTHQWQINIPGTDQWVNIQGQTGQTLNLTYALLGSLLDGSRSASVRCAAMRGGEAIEFSQALRATILEDIPVEPTVNTMPAVMESGELEVILFETSIPTETEPVVPQETVPAETEPVVPQETVPAETEPVVPGETVPAETEPVIPQETAPAETEPVVPEETVPAETEPVVPEETVPVETEPVVPEETVPVETEPVVPQETVPAETEPVVPQETVPAETEPVVPEETVPAETEPVIPETTAPVTEPPAPVAETEPVVVTEVVEIISEEPVSFAAVPVAETEPVMLTAAPTEAEADAPESPAAQTEPVAPAAEISEPAETEPVVPETTVPAETEAAVPETTVPAETEPIVPETTVPAETEPVKTPVKIETISLAPVKNSVAMETAEGDSTEDSGEADPPADDTDDFVTVTIRYVYLDDEDKPGNQTWDPYVARIHSGSNLKLVVRNKVVPAYITKLAENYAGVSLVADETGKPYDPAQHTVSYVMLDLQMVTEDQEFTVYYDEVMVPYSARYFLQNAYNDLYTEDTTLLTEDMKKNMKGFAGDPPNVAYIYPDVLGFSELFHQPELIAADGSTVFEVYYDRNYYLINFDLNGGFGTAPVYARYGTSFTVSEPSRPGYHFDGWILMTKQEDGKLVATGDIVALPTQIPAANQTYQAQWTPETTSYSVVYWLENADPESDGTYKYSYWTSVKIDNVASGTPVSALDYGTDMTVFGNDKNYISFNDKKTEYMQNEQDHLDTDRNVIVQGDGSTVLNVYFDRNDYFIKFYYARSYDTTVNNVSKTNFEIPKSTDNWSKLEPPTLDGGNTYWENAGNKPLLAPKYAKNSDSEKIDTTKYTYYYFILKAKYGADIQDDWPSAPLTNNKGSGILDENGNSLDIWSQFVSWGTEKDSIYNKTHENKNIKGAYSKMDSQLIKFEGHKYSDQHKAIEAQTMLAYYNGNPNAWDYQVYVKLEENEEIPENVPIERDVELENQATATYYWVKTIPTTSAQTEIEHQNPVSVVGLKYLGRKSISKTDKTPYIAKFYYERNKYWLQYQNYNKNMLEGDGTEVYYGKSLQDYGQKFTEQDMNENHYPSDLEPNAYYFEGWYTTPDCFSESKMDWSRSMPDSNLTVYANWVPVTYDVYFYRDYEHLLKDEAKTFEQLEAEAKANAADSTNPVNFFQYKLDTDHGKHMLTDGLTLNLGQDGNKTFVQWFYLDDQGKKVAFNPAEMVVRRNMKLFAEWTSTTSVSYEVRYLLGTQDGEIAMDGAGNPYDLATITTGYGFEAATRTFQAKGATQLDLIDAIPDEVLDQYKPSDGEDTIIWLPNTNSHSILLKAPLEDPENPGAYTNPNKFSFVYSARTNAPYVIRYLDANTGEPVKYTDANGAEQVMEDDPVPNNTKAVVTEQFKYVPGYIPDAFYKRLVLSADPTENVIIFYYTKDDTNVNPDPGEGGSGTDTPGSSRYLIRHMVKSPDDSGVYEEIGTEEGVKLIGSTIEIDKIEPLNETLYEYEGRYSYRLIDEDGNQTTVENGPAEIDFDPIVYTTGQEIQLFYTRKLIDYEVKFIDRASGKEIEYVNDQGNKVSYSKKKSAPYEKIVTEKAIPIPGYELYSAEEKELEITANAEQNVIEFEYDAIATTLYYHAMLNGEESKDGGKLTFYEETPSTNIPVNGSQVITESGYQFMGWYRDQGCTDQIKDNSWLTEDGTKLIPQINFTDNVKEEAQYDYYAKFEPITLTIEQSGMTGADSGVYTIQNAEGTPALSMTVLISGNHSATIEQIPAGNYIVTETSWAWKYTRESAQDVLVAANTDNTVSFSHTNNGTCWLHAEGS